MPFLEGIKKMQRFKKILLVLDGKSNHKPALTRALELAKVNKAQLKIIDVLDSPVPEVQFGTPFELEKLILEKQDLIEMEVESRRSKIQNLIKVSSVNDIRLSSDVLLGKPYFETIYQVLKFNFDLVIKNSEGKAGLIWGFLGNNDFNLIRKCPCPVWLIKPNQTKKFKGILAAVDLDIISNDNGEEKLNKKIIEIAVSLAQKEKSDLHVLHVWDFILKSDSKSLKTKLSESQLKKLIAWEKKKREEILNQLVSEYSPNGLNVKFHLVKGDPKKDIPKFAKNKKIELLVMGTVGRTGIPGFFIGNTSESILNKINCSLLTVKPDGFISPVTLENEN